MAVDDPCDEEKKYLGKAAEIGTPQENPPCDIITERKIPDELREPQPQGGQAETLTPGPLVILSRPVHVECPPDDGSVGEAIDYPAGYYQEELYLSIVPSLTQNVLEYIAKNKLEAGISSVLDILEPDPKQLRKLTGMKLAEAKKLISEAKEIQDRLTTAVLSLATSQLQCCWPNNPLTLRCEDPEMVKPEEDTEVIYEVSVEAGKFISCISQEDADRQAREYLEPLLNCFYTNDEYVALCEERDIRPADKMEAVPNDEEEIYPGKGLRVGRVVVEKGKFKSKESKEDANAQAKSWGDALLVCWYPSDPVRKQCEDPNARDIGVDPETTPAHAADAPTNTVGQWVDIPYGFYTSELSAEQATAEAEALAEALLQCCYISRAIRIECEEEEVITKEKETIYVPAEGQPTSPVPVVELPAGAFTSCVSQEEADSFARLSVEGMLDCYYCNELVLPTCVPEWVIEDVKLPPDHPDHIDLPLRDGFIFDTTHPNLPLSALPLNATLGAARCAVISQDAQNAYLVADSLATVVAGGEDLCTYYNDKVIVACAAADPYTGKVLDCGDEGYWSVDPDGEPYFFYSMYAPGTCLYEDMTTPAPGEYIIIDAGMFMDAGEDKKDLLNERAVTYAMVLLQCTFTNPEVYANCFRNDEMRHCTYFEDKRYCSYDACSKCQFYDGARGENFCLKGACKDSDNICDTTWDWGKQEVFPEIEEDSRDNPKYLMDWSNGDGNTIVIPRGTVLVQGECPEVAKALIADYVNDLARAQLRCNYGNPRVCSDPCVDKLGYHGSVGGGVNICPQFHNNNPKGKQLCIDAKTVIGESVAEAKAVAKKMVEGAQFCSTDYFMTYNICMGQSPTPIPSSPSSTPIPDHPPFPDGYYSSSEVLSDRCKDLSFEIEELLREYPHENAEEPWDHEGEFPEGMNPTEEETETVFRIQTDETGQILYKNVRALSEEARAETDCFDEAGNLMEDSSPTYIQASFIEAHAYDIYGGWYLAPGVGVYYFTYGVEIKLELHLMCGRNSPELIGCLTVRTPPWPFLHGSSAIPYSSSSVASSYPYSSPAVSGVCFYDCPNYKAAKAQTVAAPVTGEMIIDKQAEMQRWDTDVAYQYAHAKEELEELEKKLRALTDEGNM